MSEGSIAAVAPPRAVQHALSVDVEDWYHDGGGVPSQERVEVNTRRVLDVFAAAGARATFFFLGEVAERMPALVRQVAAAGHEIGSHGFHHRPLHEVLWREFRAKGWNEQEPEPGLAAETATRFRRNIVALVANGRIARKTGAELMGVEEEELESLVAMT